MASATCAVNPCAANGGLRRPCKLRMQCRDRIELLQRRQFLGLLRVHARTAPVDASSPCGSSEEITAGEGVGHGATSDNTATAQECAHNFCQESHVHQIQESIWGRVGGPPWGGLVGA